MCKISKKRLCPMLQPGKKTSYVPTNSLYLLTEIGVTNKTPTKDYFLLRRLLYSSIALFNNQYKFYNGGHGSVYKMGVNYSYSLVLVRCNATPAERAVASVPTPLRPLPQEVQPAQGWPCLKLVVKYCLSQAYRAHLTYSLGIFIHIQRHCLSCFLF